MYLEVMKEKREEIFENYGKPYYVYLSLSNYCNANCCFCDVRLNKQKQGIINVKEVINELAELGSRYIHFTGGGEPFVNDDIFEYLKYCTLKNMKIILISNGLNLTEEKIIKMTNYSIDTFFFSIDSHIPAIHDELRGKKGLWAKVTGNINLLKKYMPDVKIVINHVINSLNIDEFPNFIKMKENVNFDYINPIIIKDFINLFPTFNQINNYNKNIVKIYKLAETYSVKFLIKDINILNDSVKNNGDIHNSGNFKCVYPNFCVFIDAPTGDVYPCDCSIHRDRDLYKIGNLIDNTFSEIWHGNKRNYLSKKLLNGNLDCKRKCDEANCWFNDSYFEYKGCLKDENSCIC